MSACRYAPAFTSATFSASSETLLRPLQDGSERLKTGLHKETASRAARLLAGGLAAWFGHSLPFACKLWGALGTAPPHL